MTAWSGVPSGWIAPEVKGIRPNPAAVNPPEFRNGHGKPVVALDLDGTLGNYHLHFLTFAAGYFGREMPKPTAINPGRELWEHMEVTQEEYRQCKLAYRQGGMKRTMPMYEGSDHLTWGLQKEGVEVWICTTRPYLRLDNIDPDTREWLSRRDISFDAVIFGKDKYKELIRQVGLDRIVAVADDLPEMTKQAKDAGIQNVYLRDQPYNQPDSVPWGLVPVTHYDQRYHDNTELWSLIYEDLKNWNEEHR